MYFRKPLWERSGSSFCPVCDHESLMRVYDDIDGFGISFTCLNKDCGSVQSYELGPETKQSIESVDGHVCILFEEEEVT